MALGRGSRESREQTMALDESFKRPGNVPFNWEVQPGIPKQQQAPGTAPAPALALPPAARVGAPLASASCRRASSSSSVASSVADLLSPTAPAPSHRRSMSARFATSLALMPLPFVTRRGRGGGRAGAAKDDAADFCLLYAEHKVA